MVTYQVNETEFNEAVFIGPVPRLQRFHTLIGYPLEILSLRPSSAANGKDQDLTLHTLVEPVTTL